MKRYLILLALFLVFQTSYAQLIALPWGNGVCKGCRAELPVDPFATVNDIKNNLTFALMQDGVDSPQVEITPIIETSSPIGRTYHLVIRSKNAVILVTKF